VRIGGFGTDIATTKCFITFLFKEENVYESDNQSRGMY
jgi:hypothetical protein